MTVQSIKVTDGSTNTSSYIYGNQSGGYASIDAVAGESTVYKDLNKESTTEQLQQKWSGLSTTAKIGIICAVGGILLIVVIACTVCCCMQRRRGRAEKALADREWDQQHNELMEYRERMKRGEFAVTHLGHGDKW